MSLWAATQSPQGITLVTDSAQERSNELGELTASLARKTWTLPLFGGGTLWIACCGSLRVTPPPAPWPSPFPDEDKPRTFAHVAEAIKVQMREINHERSAFELLLVGGDPASFPKMAKISDRHGVEQATRATIFTGGLANRVRSIAPAFAPSSMPRCRDLVVSLASRALRDYVNDQPGHGPVISWPLHLMTWAWLPWSDGGMRTHFEERMVQEAEGMPAERRAFAAGRADAAAPDLNKWVTEKIVSRLETDGLRPEDVRTVVRVVDVKVEPLAAPPASGQIKETN